MSTELATAEPELASALLGVTPPDEPSTEVLPRLRLLREVSREGELTIVDGGSVA